MILVDPYQAIEVSVEICQENLNIFMEFLFYQRLEASPLFEIPGKHYLCRLLSQVIRS